MKSVVVEESFNLLNCLSTEFGVVLCSVSKVEKSISVVSRRFRKRPHNKVIESVGPFSCTGFESLATPDTEIPVRRGLFAASRTIQGRCPVGLLFLNVESMDLGKLTVGIVSKIAT